MMDWRVLPELVIPAWVWPGQCRVERVQQNVLTDYLRDVHRDAEIYTEFPAAGGRIDIVVRWPDRMLIYELKRWVAKDDAVRQLRRYMEFARQRWTPEVMGCVAAPRLRLVEESLADDLTFLPYLVVAG